MAELKIGSTLQCGKYEITKVLGSGNFGITYLATTKIAVNGQLGQMDVSVNVAIKEFYMKDLNNRTLDGSIVEGTQNTMVKNYRQKFKKEAENLAKLHHPNIVKVIEVFDENNTTYYVMEYVEGGSLDDYIKSKGRLTEEEALQCTLEIADALSYMHKNMMIHLDLKPKNIMRNSKGHLYLIDFGLSKQYDENGEPESSTSIGLGTPGYAPLEQASYKQDGTLPVTLDVYALGASLFKMLTGKTPPESSAILNEGFPLSSLQKVGISDNMISIIEKAMAVVKKDRYQSIDSMSNAIENITSDGEQTSYPDKAERTVYEEEVEVMSEDAHADSPVNKNDITDNNEKVLNCKIGKKRIGIIVGLGFLVLLLLCTISNIPLEIRSIVGYRAGDAEDFLIRNWNTGIVGLCLSLIGLMYYVFSKKRIAAYIAITVAFISLVFLTYFISSENEEQFLTQSPPSKENVLEVEKKAVDLGLPSGTLWANCNIGAKSELEDGEHYAFGTIVSKGSYPENTGNEYKEGESIIGSSCDIASVQWGKDWQLPSKDQFNELIKKCKFYIQSRGYKVVGPNGNYIFLPYTRGNSCIGYYWSGNKGYVLEFQPGNKGIDQIDEAELAYPFATYCGLSIRPVKK